MNWLICYQKVSVVKLRVLTVMEADKTTDGLEGVKRKKFTWRELSKLNGRHNAHVAVRGKVFTREFYLARAVTEKAQLIRRMHALIFTGV